MSVLRQCAFGMASWVTHAAADDVGEKNDR